MPEAWTEQALLDHRKNLLEIQAAHNRTIDRHEKKIGELELTLRNEYKVRGIISDQLSLVEAELTSRSANNGTDPDDGHRAVRPL